MSKRASERGTVLENQHALTTNLLLLREPYFEPELLQGLGDDFRNRFPSQFMLGHEEMPETSFREWRNLNQQQVSEHTGGICGLRGLSRRIEFQVVGSRSAEVMEHQHR